MSTVNISIKFHFALPYRACCTACEVHTQNILGRQFDSGLDLVWERRLRWCLMTEVLRKTLNKKKYFHIFLYWSNVENKWVLRCVKAF